MPAYRSPDEREIRDAVVARLRLLRPGARIIHEIQSACQGPNRFDLVAVDAAEIIAVEIKSAKDKLDRLPDQIAAMRGAAHHVIAALHHRFLVPYGSSWRRPRAPDGTVEPPPQARGAEVWAYPEAGADAGRTWGCAAWQEPRFAVTLTLPQGALDMLWADELRALCRDLGLTVRSDTTRPQAMAMIRWRATGEQITKGVCRALRRRVCIEADPAVEAAA